MKKLMILAVVATLALGSSSCKKNGDCVCEIGGIEISSTPGISKADCNTLDDAAQAGGGSCSLK
jgi:hypothetical protein